MDAEAFDRLVRALTGGRSRRGLLSLLAGLPLVSTVVTRQPDVAVAQCRKTHRHHAQHQHRHTTTQRREAQRHDPHSAACIPTGQRCPAKKPRGKHHKKLGCTQCCQGSFVTDAAGKKVCGCQPNGGACPTDTASACCSGYCNGTTCQAAPCSAAIPCPACQTCNSATGVCGPAADGTSCDDGNACTQTATCQDGRCVGSNPVVCTALDQCHDAGVCNPATGVCSNPNKTDGTACNDGDLCTQTDTCLSGVCVGSNPVVCHAPPICHIAAGATCDPATGQCVYPNETNRTVCGGSGATTSICCNGTCCGGCCGSDGACGACRVFVTSTSYLGDLGGLDGAAAKCQERAEVGNQPGGDVPGTYQAWLSDTTGSPSTRFRRSAQPYQMPNGAAIATSYADLVNGTLATALNRTEFNGLSGGAVVLTDTRHDGTPGGQCPQYPASLHCENWTNDTTGFGGAGNSRSQTCAWTAAGFFECHFSGACLYCFQQR